MNESTSGQLELESDAENTKIKYIIESILFASNIPITASRLHSALKSDFIISKKNIDQLILELKEEYDNTNRSFELISGSTGYLLKTRKEYAPWIKKILKEKNYDRVSKAALETLAIITYKQPLTRAAVEEIRGVNVDNAMRTLMEKELIYVSGKKEIPGKPPLYSTTKNFLINFGLKNLQELPPIDKFTENN